MLSSLSCFQTKGGAFESPKKEKRSHRRWRSRAIGKDAKGMLQVTFASSQGLPSAWRLSARHGQGPLAQLGQKSEGRGVDLSTCVDR